MGLVWVCASRDDFFGNDNWQFDLGFQAWILAGLVGAGCWSGCWSGCLGVWVSGGCVMLGAGCVQVNFYCASGCSQQYAVCII